MNGAPRVLSHARAVAVVGDVDAAAATARAATATHLAALQAAAFASELGVRFTAEEWVGVAFGNDDVGFGDGVGDFSGYIIFEAGRDVLIGGVIVHALRVDAAERRARIDLERRPGWQAGGDLVGEDWRVASGLE